MLVTKCVLYGAGPLKSGVVFTIMHGWFCCLCNPLCIKNEILFL